MTRYFGGDIGFRYTHRDDAGDEVCYVLFGLALPEAETEESKGGGCGVEGGDELENEGCNIRFGGCCRRHEVFC